MTWGARPQSGEDNGPAFSHEEPDWLSQDSAENALWKAIENVQFGNKTDDKLILEQLKKQGVWLVRFSEGEE